MPEIMRFHKTGNADIPNIGVLPPAGPGRGGVRLKMEAAGRNRSAGARF